MYKKTVTTYGYMLSSYGTGVKFNINKKKWNCPHG